MTGIQKANTDRPQKIIFVRKAAYVGQRPRKWRADEFIRKSLSKIEETTFNSLPSDLKKRKKLTQIHLGPYTGGNI